MWKSSKGKIASVSADGVVSALKTGNAKITVTTANKKKVTTLVHVVATPEPAPAPDPTPVPAPDPTPEPVDNSSYELRYYLGKSVDQLNADIPDDVVWDGSTYGNKYFSVEVGNDNTIIAIRLMHSIPLSEGGAKYQIFSLSPNMVLSENDRILKFALWKPAVSSSNGTLYTSTGFPSQYLTIFTNNGVIRSISYTYA